MTHHQPDPRPADPCTSGRQHGGRSRRRVGIPAGPASWPTERRGTRGSGF